MRRLSVSQIGALSAVTAVAAPVAVPVAFSAASATSAPSASSAAERTSLTRTVTAQAVPASQDGTGVVLKSVAVAGSLHAYRPRHAGGRYTVVSGDSLSAIAGREYAQAACWPGIYRANRSQVSDPDKIYPGQTLAVPDGCDSSTPAAPPPPVTTAQVSSSSSSSSSESDSETGTAPNANTAPAQQPVSYSQPASSGGYAVSSSFEACVIRAESGGNAQIWNASRHWGLYQFSYDTWVAHGGDPALFGVADAAYQHQIFMNTVAQDGTSDWAPYDGC